MTLLSEESNKIVLLRAITLGLRAVSLELRATPMRLIRVIYTTFGESPLAKL